MVREPQFDGYSAGAIEDFDNFIGTLCEKGVWDYSFFKVDSRLDTKLISI